MSYSATFEEIEGKTQTAEGVALLLKNWRDGIRALVVGPILFAYLVRKLKQTVEVLSTEAIETMNHEELQKLSADLTRLHQLLLVLARLMVEGKPRGAPVKSFVDSTEDIGDILENILMYRNERFAALVEKSISEVDSQKNESRVAAMPSRT